MAKPPALEPAAFCSSTVTGVEETFPGQKSLDPCVTFRLSPRSPRFSVLTANASGGEHPGCLQLLRKAPVPALLRVDEEVCLMLERDSG